MNNQENASRRVLAILVLAGSWGVALGAQVEAPFTSSTRYNVAGQVTGTIAPDPDGSGPLRLLATRNTYNSLGLLEKTENGQLTVWADENISPASWGGYGFSGANIFRTAEFSYDAYGRKTKELVRGVDGNPEALVQYSYDSESFVRCKAVRMNKSLFLTPPSDPCALGPEGSQGPDRIFRYTNDIFGQVTQEERAVGTPQEQVYAVTTYAMRSPTSYTDANGNRTELKYTDGYGRVTELWYPSAATPGVANSSDKNKYEYDQNGNLWRETKRNGTATVTKTFDALNRVTYKDLSDNSKGEDISYDYDTRGLALFARSSPSSAIGVFNEFDGFGRLKTATNVAVVGTTTASRALKYLYDANGNRTQVKHPDNTIFNYSFDGLNRANCVSEGGNCDSNDTGRLVNIEYRADGKRNRLLRPGGATTNYDVDNAGRLLTFGQDFVGSADDLTNTFYYNPSGQAVQLTYGNSAFAPVGNQNRTGSYSVNGLNQYTNVGGTITYDANGNLNSDAPAAFTYDMENRLSSMTNPAGALKYDPLGRLTEYTAPPAASIQFLYDGDALVAEYTVSGNSSTLTKRYVHGTRVDEPWVQYNGAIVGAAARRYLHADHQSSIIAQSNSSGTILGSKLAYDVFGIPQSSNYDRFGYTGQMWLKELGLFYYKARIYHPKLGRFLQTDPIGAKDDINLYAYVRNDPVNMSDPTGKVGVCVTKKKCEYLQNLINELASAKYFFNSKNELQKDPTAKEDKNKSSYYSERLDEMIAAKGKITMGVTKALIDQFGHPRKVEGGNTLFLYDPDMGKRSAQVGITGLNYTGGIKDVDGKPLTETPAFILMHELVGHGIPFIGGFGSGNAIQNENNVREQLIPKVPQREFQHEFEW